MYIVEEGCCSLRPDDWTSLVGPENGRTVSNMEEDHSGESKRKPLGVEEVRGTLKVTPTEVEGKGVLV